MLSVSGIIRITDDPQEKPFNTGFYFNFTSESKDPFKKGGRKYYKVALYVGDQDIAVARKEIIKGASIWIRHGDLDGTKSTNPQYNTIFNTVKCSWKEIEVLVMTLRADVQ